MGVFLYLCAENKLHSQFESKLSLRSLALFFAKENNERYGTETDRKRSRTQTAQ